MVLNMSCIQRLQSCLPQRGLERLSSTRCQEQPYHRGRGVETLVAQKSVDRPKRVVGHGKFAVDIAAVRNEQCSNLCFSLLSCRQQTVIHHLLAMGLDAGVHALKHPLYQAGVSGADGEREWMRSPAEMGKNRLVRQGASLL